jgi:O-acetyl-ADP-ribose deacetylase (regulator of RNase III)
MVRGKMPSFVHSAVAMGMSRSVFAPTCLTTNFDKLVEQAFGTFGDTECQAIRTRDEVEFMKAQPNKCYVLKLHGDYDTHNIQNTDSETIAIDEVIAGRAIRELEGRGLLVIGLAGYEASIHRFFDSLCAKESREKGVLEHGLLWGVYAGETRPPKSSQATAEQVIAKAIGAGVVGPEVLRVIQDRVGDRVPFAFFPIWGAGSFLWHVFNRKGDPELTHLAESHLDHELRIRDVFQRKGLTPQAQDEHLVRLRKARAAIKGSSAAVPIPEVAFRLKVAGANGTINLAYGDIADTRLLFDARISRMISAIVSPEDTCLSIGGGAALSIANGAGVRTLVHELSKFAPVSHGEAVVTSSYRLPTNYIIHAASVDIQERGPQTSQSWIRTTVTRVLTRCEHLSIKRIWLPLLGAGVAGLTPVESLQAIGDELAAAIGLTAGMDVTIVVYKEALIDRRTVRQTLIDAYQAHGRSLI